MATDNVCPPLGTGSVDFNALHAAAMKGGDLIVAIEDATTRALPGPEIAEVAAELAPAVPAAKTSAKA